MEGLEIIRFKAVSIDNLDHMTMHPLMHLYSPGPHFCLDTFKGFKKPFKKVVKAVRDACGAWRKANSIVFTKLYRKNVKQKVFVM